MSELTHSPFDTREDNPMPIPCPVCGWETLPDSLSPNDKIKWLVLKAIEKERDRQDTKWGVQDHTDEWWLAILMEEVGELAEAILHAEFGGNKDKNIHKEAVQCAAVCIAMLECINRRAEEKR